MRSAAISASGGGGGGWKVGGFAGEGRVSPNPLRELWGVPALGPDGMVEIPQGPGLGIEVDPAAFAPYLVRRGEVTPE